MSTYTIDIVRTAKDGDLTFTNTLNNKTITAKCFWDITKKIPAGTYKNCSATTMSNKKNSLGKARESIFIPNVQGFSGIFFHMGKSPFENWSDGCIVINEAKIIEIYNAISPKDGHNITVKISG